MGDKVITFYAEATYRIGSRVAEHSKVSGYLKCVAQLDGKVNTFRNIKIISLSDTVEYDDESWGLHTGRIGVMRKLIYRTIDDKVKE